MRGENENNDWPHHKLLILENMRECREFQEEMRKTLADLTKRVDDSHNENKWLREKMVYVASGMGALVGTIYGLVSDNWEKLFK